MKISGMGPSEWHFFYTNFLLKRKKEEIPSHHLIVCPTADVLEDVYSNLKKAIPDILIFPGHEINPFSEVFSSSRNLFQRFFALAKILQGPNPIILLCTPEGLVLKNPPLSFFSENSLLISTSDIISPVDLAARLIRIGYFSSTTVEEPGTFSRKGEIFDIFPTLGGPVRLHYFDEMIEDIFLIDQQTNKSIREKKLKDIFIPPAPGIFTNDPFRSQLRENLPMPSPLFKRRHEARKELLQSLANGRLFDNYPLFVSSFFAEHSTLLDFFTTPNGLITFISADESVRSQTEEFELIRADYARRLADSEDEMVTPSPEKIYDLDRFAKIDSIKALQVNSVAMDALTCDLDNSIAVQMESARIFLNNHVNPAQDKFEYFNQLFDFFKTHFQYNGNIIFLYENINAKEEIAFLIDGHAFSSELLSRISYQQFSLDQGFYYFAEKLLVLTSADLFSKKRNKAKATRQINIDLFAEQMASLVPGDYVIHSTHGLGQYLGLEAMQVGSSTSDFLVLLYDENDKIYVPVYKINLIQKSAPATAGLKLNNLRSKKFQQIKERAKNAAKELAFDLLKLQAERKSSPAFAFSPPDHHFKEFELAFPFNETKDQVSAINNVLDAMQAPTPMDHLVCGDVGFGKTEVAMRAAFKAVLDGKQVAILVPTTILALQHYNSFVERFANFPVKIDFLSRFKSAPQAKKLKEDLAEGKVDIVIGTHMLLADSMKFKSLGLVVVDEEQRFGVGHKEKLKLMKATLDFLTLTATPIPRTLQLAFLGLRDLSLIQTAPPKRQSIKTYLIKEDFNTIKHALEQELARGGQVFYVHNRVNDIEMVREEIIKMVPTAKIVVAHGQLPERQLEEKISAFYSGKYHILLSTTIIESGIDIPNANTMIINRADTFGLAQLHQLRGRIGRSDRKAYAYFVIPKEKKLTTIAEQRLKALQTYADMGSGFSIASSDLEIRGAGDILGASQSGHIEEVGLELYMELLKEAIAELKGEQRRVSRDLEISTPFPAYIPHSYITDSAERLRIYKKLSNCTDLSVLYQIIDDISDIFGSFPEEIKNLFTIIEAKIILGPCALKSIAVAGSTLTFKFDREAIDKDTALRDRIVKLFTSRPKVYKINPDYSVIYGHREVISQEVLLKISKDVAEQLVKC